MHQELGHEAMLDQYDPTVLIVEPNLHFAAILRQILAIGGVSRIQHAADAYEALEAIKYSHVDIVLLDSEITDFPASALAHVIRTAEDSPNTKMPIIFMTDCPTLRFVDQAARAGGDSCVKKPTSVQTLLQHMKWLLDGRHEPIEPEGTSQETVV